MNLHLVVLLSYAVVLMVLGLWLGARVRHSSDFFVASRRLGPFLMCATMLAANIGAGSTVNGAGLGYRDGLSAWWWVGSAGLGSIALAFWVGPRIRSLAAKHQLHTVGDFLEHRYGRSVRATISVLLWIGTLAILAGQLMAIGRVLNVVTGTELWVGCVIGGLVVTVYFTAGGLLTAAWVNVVQLAVLLTGFAVAVPLALSAVGGLGPRIRGHERSRRVLELLGGGADPVGFTSPCWGQRSSSHPVCCKRSTGHVTIERCGWALASTPACSWCSRRRPPCSG